MARRAAYAVAPGVLLAGVAGGIAFPILPLVGVRAGLPLWFIGVILAANRAARIVASPLVGVLCDRMGARRVLIAGLALQVAVMGLYVLGMALGQPGLYFLLARLLHGPGSACVFVGAQTLALHAGGREYGGRTAGIVRAALSAGMPVGLAAGGVLAAVVGEQTTFAIAMAAVAGGSLVAFATVPDLRAPPGEGTERKAPWRLLGDRHLLAIGVLNFASFLSAQGVVLTTIVLLVNDRGLRLFGLGDQGTAGLAMGFMVLVSSATMVLAGRVGDRWKVHARIAILGLVVAVPGLVTVGLGQSMLVVGVGIGLVGLGMGALGPSLLALLAALVEPQQRGSAAGAMQLCGDVGGVLGPLCGTTLLAYGPATPYLASAALLAVALPCALWLGLERDPRRALAAPPVMPAAPDLT